MRALLVLLTLVATPFALTVAQSDRSATAREHGCEMRDAKVTNPTARERALQHCVLVPTDGTGEDPPPAGDPPPTWGGTSSIDGTVFQSSDPWPGLAGWTVELSGAVNTSTTTDGSGNYLFAGLPAGTYTVCEHIESGWVQTSPTSGTSCPTGVGYTFSLSDGISGSFVNFGNLPQ